MLHLLWEYIQRVKLNIAYKGYYYNAHQILFVWICGAMCGQATMKDVWIWANTEKVKDLFYKEIGLCYFPKYPMFTLILGKFDEKSFEEEYRKWIKLFPPESLTEKVVAFDGKTIKTTANRKDLTQSLHIVNAYITELGLTLGQLAVNEKTNEIPTVQLLIKQLDLEGTIIVADALNCQKTVDEILYAGADYVLSVKKNQPELYESIKDSFEIQLNDEFDKKNNPLPTASESKMGHGRFENRTVYVDYIVDWCEKAGQFNNCQSFAMIVWKCEQNGKKTIETHYFICSKKYTPQQVLDITSQEWGIEAMHWSLDNTLAEDKCTLSKSKLISSNIVRKIALAYITFLININNINNTLRGYMKFLSFNPEKLLN